MTNTIREKIGSEELVDIPSKMVDISKLEFHDGNWYVRGAEGSGAIHPSKIHGSLSALINQEKEEIAKKVEGMKTNTYASTQLDTWDNTWNAALDAAISVIKGK